MYRQKTVAVVIPAYNERERLTVTLPATMAPAAGAVIDTDGGCVSPVTIALASFVDGPMLPAASSAVTR